MGRESEGFQVMPSNEIMTPHDLVKKYNLAYFAFAIVISVVFGMECASSDLKYSTLCVSKNSFVPENWIMVMN